MKEEEKFILNLQEKYEKLANEYNEVGRNQLHEKYNDLAYLMYKIRCLIQDGYKYRIINSNKDN